MYKCNPTKACKKWSIFEASTVLHLFFIFWLSFFFFFFLLDHNLLTHWGQEKPMFLHLKHNNSGMYLDANYKIHYIKMSISSLSQWFLFGVCFFLCVCVFKVQLTVFHKSNNTLCDQRILRKKRFDWLLINVDFCASVNQLRKFKAVPTCGGV